MCNIYHTHSQTSSTNLCEWDGVSLQSTALLSPVKGGRLHGHTNIRKISNHQVCQKPTYRIKGATTASTCVSAAVEVLIYSVHKEFYRWEAVETCVLKHYSFNIIFLYIYLYSICMCMCVSVCTVYIDCGNLTVRVEGT